MKKLVAGIVIVIVIAAGIWFVGTYFEVDAEGDFEMPKADVDVDVEGGNIPEFEVQAPDVEVGTKEVDVPVPDIDIDTERKQIKVPAIDVEKPGEEGNVVNE